MRTKKVMFLTIFNNNILSLNLIINPKFKKCNVQVEYFI